MASKKIKKLLAAGLAGYAGAKMLGQKKEMKKRLAKHEGQRRVYYLNEKASA